jgi:hypothetical protein
MAASPVCLTAMLNSINRHEVLLITDIVEHSVVSDPDAISINTAELLHAKGARIISQKGKTESYPRYFPFRK